MGILEEIRGNEIDTLHLMNVPEDYFEHTKDFVDAMSSNTSIKKVIFEKDFLACVNGQERADVVGSVGRLPNVESVILKDSLLQVGVCVKDLVKNATKLQELHAENCVMQGVPESFDLLKDSIKGNSSFKTICINDCTAPNESVDLSKIMDSLKDPELNIDVTGGGAKA